MFLCFHLYSEGDSPGIKESDLVASVHTLEKLAETNDASCVMLRQRNTSDGIVGEYLLRKLVDELDFLEVRYMSYEYMGFIKIVL